MHSRLLLIFLFSVLYSCSVTKTVPAEPELLIDQAKLSTAVDRSVEEIIKGEWLSEFIVKKNERPVLICTKVDLPQNTSFPVDSLYNILDMSLIKTGQVRVIKASPAQRTTIPYELANGESIDYVLTAAIEKRGMESASNPVFILRLWNEITATPLAIVKNIIE